jgi:hypothetical protein
MVVQVPHILHQVEMVVAAEAVPVQLDKQVQTVLLLVVVLVVMVLQIQ